MATLGNLEKVRALAVSGRMLAVGGVRADAGSQLTFFDHVGEVPDKVASLGAHVLSLAADELGFVAGCSDGVLRWFSATGQAEREVPAHGGAVYGVALRGDLLVSVGADGVLKSWSRKTGAARPSDVHLSSRALRAVAIDVAGTAVATGGDDGVVRVVRLGDGSVREMPGHEGSVLSLCFTQEDGRLISGGEDGSTRLWYLEGDVEADVRGKDDTGHVGGTTAIVLLPAKDRERTGERFFTAGLDGKVRLWRVGERRKPRSFDTKGAEPLYALVLGAITRPGTTGRLYGSGDARNVFAIALNSEGEPEDKRSDFGNGFEQLATDLNAAALPKRDATIRKLAALGEPEALELIRGVLQNAREPELRALAASQLGEHRRLDAKQALRERLDDQHESVRLAAFDALTKLEASAPLAPPRAALGSKYADMRVAALRALPPLAGASPLVRGIIAGQLRDADASARRAAVAALVATHGEDPATALRLAFERGADDVRAEVLVRAAAGKLLDSAALAPLLGKALDDENADVRRIAFVVSVLQRPRLLAWLEPRDEAFGRALGDVLRRAGELSGKAPDSATDEVISKVRTVTSNFVQFQHPTHGDITIFKPAANTPLKVGDEVRLIGVKPKERRAADYVLATSTSGSGEPALRAALITPATGEPNEADREPLLAALVCRSPDTSLRGAYGLALFEDMRALGALLTISREPDPSLRREAAHALVALRDTRAERRLAWMTSDPVQQVRDAALACYAKLEADPLRVAAIALGSGHEDIRVRGLDILVKQGQGKPRAEELLQDALNDEAPVVRAEAFRTLWAWHTADPLVPLDRALEARFADLRARAVAELFAIAKHKEAGREGAARERLFKAIADRDLVVARAAYEATSELRGKTDADTYLAAVASTLPELRARGAKEAREAQGPDKKAPLDKLRSPLTKLLEDTAADVRLAALETLDRLLTDDVGPLYVGLQSSHLELRVRAAELLAARRDEQLVGPMQALIADQDLLARQPQLIGPLRHRAATALASLGSPRLLRYFATELIKDDDSGVREQASRGVSNSSRRGEEGYLLDLLGHADIAVRSWAGEGLARLGDARGVPVLTGTLRHEHPPIRVGAIVSFAALGAEGYAGMLQGLEDPSRDVQRIVLSVILARDLRAFRHGEPPELLTTALSSQRPEVRFAAARALELRIWPEQYAAHLIEVLLPERPEKATEMERWPDEATRAQLMMALAAALAGDRPEQRYAAAQVLRLRGQPEAFFREAARAVRLASTAAPWVPETTPNAPPPPAEGSKGPLGLLRRLFAAGPQTPATASSASGESPVGPDEQQRLRLLAFGAYVGLLRQATSDDEAHRVRRDAIERVVELVKANAVNATSATMALARALDDPHHLVRRAALAALRTLHGSEPERHLALALAASASDVVRAALDELSEQGASARPRIVKALDSDVADARRYAFELLEKSAAPGSLEPLLAALGSAHADLRIGVLERLATSQDPRVAAALGKALESDHEDLRLRAAELLAGRRDERAVDVLGACLRSDEATIATRACDALARIGTTAAVAQLAARIEELGTDAKRVPLLQALGKTRVAAAVEALQARFSDDDALVRATAVAAAEEVIGPRDDTKPERDAPKPRKPDQALALRYCEAASKSRYPDVRLKGAERLDDVTDPAADALLLALFTDRSVEVRARAVAAYAVRVEKRNANPGPLLDVIRGGARETMLSAAEGLVQRAHAEAGAAFRPLLLFVRAGEEGERERALLALGTLGDERALSELETIASGGTEEAPVDEPMQAAALEALGRVFSRLKDGDARERTRDRIESAVGSRKTAFAVAAVKALRAIADDRSRGRIEGVLASGLSTEERLAAAEALAALKHVDSEPVLARALNDDDDDVRFAARDALSKLFPSERTRIELWAVESEHSDISEPAAAFLAKEGDAAVLLSKLAKVSDYALRERLRFGLARRSTLPGAALSQLLADGTTAARSDAAWISAVATDAVPEGERATLGRALVGAVVLANEKRAEAERRGKSEEASEETDALVHAVWAARRLGSPELAPVAQRLLDGQTAPLAARVEAARSLRQSGIESLRRALSDPELRLRGEAASSLGAAEALLASVVRSPLDSVVLGRVASGRPLPQATPEAALRRVLTPLALGSRNLGPLLAQAQAKSDTRLEAIAQLALAPTADAVALLQKLAAKGSGEPEDVRKQAYRALRRAQRRLAKEVRP